MNNTNTLTQTNNAELDQIMGCLDKLFDAGFHLIRCRIEPMSLENKKMFAKGVVEYLENTVVVIKEELLAIEAEGKEA